MGESVQSSQGVVALRSGRAHVGFGSAGLNIAWNLVDLAVCTRPETGNISNCSPLEFNDIVAPRDRLCNWIIDHLCTLPGAMARTALLGESVQTSEGWLELRTGINNRLHMHKVRGPSNEGSADPEQDVQFWGGPKSKQVLTCTRCVVDAVKQFGDGVLSQLKAM